MSAVQDGPASGQFAPARFRGKVRLTDLAAAGVSREMAAAAEHAPTGECVCWGIRFRIGGSVVVVRDRPVRVNLAAVRAQWLVFLHTSDLRPIRRDKDGFVARPMRGRGRLGEPAARYVILYADGSERAVEVRRRFEVGAFTRGWGENCLAAVAHRKPHTLGEPINEAAWGRAQTRATAADGGPWVNWLFAWENPVPRKEIVGVRFEPIRGTVVVSAISAGAASSLPIRWQSRQKALLKLPRGVKLGREPDEAGRFAQVQLDMGQVISVVPRHVYPNDTWGRTYNNKPPTVSRREAIVEYAAHPDARFHLPGGRTVPVARLQARGTAGPLVQVPPARKRVTIRVVEKGAGRPVAVKLHVHGGFGEYLPPLDHHRQPNSFWFEDYGTEFNHQGVHHCVYSAGVSELLLPLGRVFIEVSKGFEARPVRKAVRVTGGTDTITVELEKVLPWRQAGWVTADTHVHFLSTHSALLEGAGEGVNIVNLLASQWGELMTNVGDLDAQNGLGAATADADGEYMVRVGSENRQHVMGHISLLGYAGRIINPMTTGGPDESALGDPIDVLLTDWARQCRKQGGLVVLPHFPNPRAEHAASIVCGDIDGVEMTSWGNLYGGIDPYSLSDWYRYLNCGCFVPAVAGTDKMSASTAVGTIRTYAQLAVGRRFTYSAWMEAVKAGRTFVTYGPLMEFAVDGKCAGSRIRMTATGGTVEAAWKVASVTVPMSRVDLVVNGEVRDSRAVKPDADAGVFRVQVGDSSWIALLVRGHYPDKPEIIAAHSSPVAVEVAASPFLAAADAMTILEQIEGALAYLHTCGTRAETAACKRMRLVLTAAHRRLHNRMHAAGRYHQHTPVADHPAHHR